MIWSQLAFISLLVSNVAAWGAIGHQSVGYVAQQVGIHSVTTEWSADCWALVLVDKSASVRPVFARNDVQPVARASSYSTIAPWSSASKN